MDKPRYVEIGRIMGAFGIHGGLKIKTYNPETRLFDRSSVVFIKKGEVFHPQTVLESAPAPKGLRVRLSGIRDRNEAQALFDTPLYVPRDAFPELEEGEFYLDDLIGLTVVNVDTGAILGKVTGIIETGANDCLEVRDGEKEILVPVLDGFITDLDFENRTLTVQLPEGLLDIYAD